MMKQPTSLLLSIVLLASSLTIIGAVTVENVPQWTVREITLTASGQYTNPYKEVSLEAVFTGPGNLKQTVKGFWDGGATFKLRWTPTALGAWSYTTRSADAGLNGKTGSFNCVAPVKGSHGFLRRDAAHPYSFVFDDGARFFMWGTTYYHLMANATAGDKWKTAIDKTKAHGMNKVRMSVYTGWNNGPKTSYPPTSPFTREGRDTLNLPFWQKLDEVVAYLGQQGVLADLILFWSTPNSYGTPEQDERFTCYVVARYAAYPNVMWCVTNEWNYTKKPREHFNELGRIIKADDPYAMRGDYPRSLSVHQQTRADFQFFDQTWLSHAIVQLGVRNQGKAFREGDEWKASNAAEEGRTFRHGDEWGNYSITLNWGHRMPVVNDEYAYIGEPNDQSVPKDASGAYPKFTRAKHRQTMWGIAAAGGYGAAGDKNTYADGSPYFSANWHDTEEYGDIKRLIDFFTTKGIEYWRMSPRNDLVKAGQRVYVLAEAGRQYVIYAAAGGACKIELAEGKYAAQRFDPRTGEMTKLGEVTGGVREFKLPTSGDEQDWVLLLTPPRNVKAGKQ